MLSTTTKVDPRITRTRRMLQQAMDELRHEKLFDQITVQDITARAGVNRATFYAHFEDKYALLHYHVQQMLHGMLNRRLPENPTFTQANLRVLLLTICDYLDGFIWRCHIPSAHGSDEMIMITRMQDEVQATLLAWVRQSYPTAPPELVASTTSWVIFGAAFQWVREGRQLPAEQLADQVLRVLGAGIEPYLK